MLAEFNDNTLVAGAALLTALGAVLLNLMKGRSEQARADQDAFIKALETRIDSLVTQVDASKRENAECLRRAGDLQAKVAMLEERLEWVEGKHKT